MKGGELVDASSLFRLVRMVKTLEEIEFLRRSALIGEQSAMHAFRFARPGGTTRELVQLFRAEVATGGADFDHFAYALDGLSLATVTDRPLELSDCFSVDFGCVFEGYFSDSAVTLALQPPTSEMEAKYADLVAIINAGIAAAAPGIRASRIQKEMASVGDRRWAQVEGPTGHGLGLEIRDLPVLVPDNGRRIRDECVDESSDLPLEAGMVLNLEVSRFVPGVASFEVERTIVVTDEGATNLIPQPRDQLVVAGALNPA
jgi:Xaa-Pro aminopeptidase